MNIALIFAGGVGTRMNSKTKPKQFLQLYGKEIIVYTIENFQNSNEIDSILVVCKEEWMEYLSNLLNKYKLDKVRWIVKGGETGQESIYNGLKALESIADPKSIVLVHDGVRPFVDDILIHNCIDSVNKYGSAITVVPTVETIVSLEHDQINKIIDRSTCFIAKAPQCFYFQDLLTAHQYAIMNEYSNIIDSATLMQLYGHSLHAIIGDFDNIKITTPVDFYIFRALYDARENKQIFGV